MPAPLSPDSPDAADTAAGSIASPSPDSADAVDAVPDGITLSELMPQLPLSRASVFELIKALGITTAKGPGPGGRGRVAWLSGADARRVKTAADAVRDGQVRIADFVQGRPTLATLQTVPAAPLPASGESGDRVDAGRILARLQAAETALSSGLGLTTAETAWILGTRPAGAMVTRGKVTAVRAGFNCWVLTASGESGDAVG